METHGAFFSGVEDVQMLSSRREGRGKDGLD
jgi:hypothetical protein